MNLWKHLPYECFQVCDPKQRDIYAADIRDRLVHQILYDYLEKIYEPIFLPDSFASRKGRGVDAGVERARFFLEDTAKWNHGRCFALKCDVRKYFDSMDHLVLLELLHERVKNDKIFEVLREIVGSFRGEMRCGIPLGNIVSQIFANIYLHELDLFVRNKLKFPKYVRYNDDTLFVSANADELTALSRLVSSFVSRRLLLEIPKEKISIRKFQWGVHFLGRIILPHAVLPKTRTVRRIFQKISSENAPSYFGLLKKMNAFEIRRATREKLLFDDVC